MRRSTFRCAWPAARALALFASFLITTPSLAEIYFHEDWEAGIGNWSTSNGVWEVGAPVQTSTPYGNFCAGTNLDGDYPHGALSRLESLPFQLPASPADGYLWLRFWHWYSLEARNGTDYAAIQIWTEAAGWEDITVDFTRTSGGWVPYYCDITAYAGQEVRIGLLMDDQHSGVTSYRDPGWFVDEICIGDGSFPELAGVNSLDGIDDTTWDGWYADRGQWQLGTPTLGVGSQYEYPLDRCFGTRFAGDYTYRANSRLISPSTTLPTAPLDGILYLSFDQYVELSGSNGTDEIHLQIDDGSGWTTLLTQNWTSNLGNQWTSRRVDISAYAGQNVRFGFLVQDNHSGVTSYTGPGWYVDNLAFSEGAPFFGNPEGFENLGTGWSTLRGLWEVGTPTSGPGSARTGSSCWGTRLGGNYLHGIDDRLSSSPIDLPNTSPLLLKFWHWFSFATTNGTDRGVVQIRVAGGAWEDLDQYTGSSSGWSQVVIDLAAYAGQTVEIGFLLDDVHSGITSYRGPGWYIDDFVIEGMPEQEAPPAPFAVQTTISAGPAQVNVAHAGTADAVAIYGSPNPEFTPSLANRVAILPGNVFQWQDPNHSGWDTILYYRASVVDDMGNESYPVGDATPTSADPLPIQVDPIRNLGVQPNPFNPTTVISFELATESRVTGMVFDVAGRRVATLVDRRLPSGTHRIPFQGRDLASGVYFVRLQADGFDRTSKMILLK